MALAQAGHPVSLVARGETLRALQTQGLRMRRTDGTLAQVPVTAHSDPAALGVQDLVVIAVKAPGLPDVARAIAPQVVQRLNTGRVKGKSVKARLVTDDPID